MKDRFGDRYEKETAQQKIRSARQGNRRVKQYIQDFLQWVDKAEMPEDQLCEHLYGGVNTDLWEMTKILVVPTNDFNAMCEVLENAEQNYVRRQIHAKQRETHQRQTSKPSGGNTYSSDRGNYFENTRREIVSTARPGPTQRPQYQTRPNHPPQPKERPLPMGEPMDLSVTRQNPQNLERKGPKCYRCQRFGHIAKECKVQNVRELTQENLYAIAEEHFGSNVPNQTSEQTVFNFSDIYSSTNIPMPKIDPEDEVIIDHADAEEDTPNPFQ
jgi:hypothetical protein